MYCTKCGALNDDTMKVCTSCEATIGSPVSIASEKVKAASTDALSAFKRLALNPLGELEVAFEQLGSSRAFAVGITFGSLFAFALLFAAYRNLGWMAPSGFAGFLKILMLAVVPFVAMLVALVIIQKIFGASGGMPHASFVAGAASLPFGILAILVLILGIGNLEVIAICAFFTVCLGILTLYVGMTNVAKLSVRSATFAVPLCLGASVWISKILFMAI